MFYIFSFWGRLKDEEHSWAYVQQRGRQIKGWKQFCLIEIPGLGGGGLPPFNKAAPFHLLLVYIPVPPSQDLACIFPSN